MIARRTVPLGGLMIALALLSTGCTSQVGSPTTSSSATASAAKTAALGPIALPAHPRVYFFGDSWTHGSSADPGRGFPEVVGETLGWQVELGPNNSGAGYVHSFDPDRALFPASAKGIAPVHADLIVLAGGLNDGPGPLTDLWKEVVQTARTLQQKAGGAPVVVVGPVSPDGTVPEGLSAIDFLESGAAGELRAHYISPIQEGWFNPANVGGLVDAKTVHPNTAGHAYYAGRLAADLARITVIEPEPEPEPTATATAG